jgi:hypothetical protein
MLHVTYEWLGMRSGALWHIERRMFPMASHPTPTVTTPSLLLHLSEIKVSSRLIPSGDFQGKLFHACLLGSDGCRNLCLSWFEDKSLQSLPLSSLSLCLCVCYPFLSLMKRPVPEFRYYPNTGQSHLKILSYIDQQSLLLQLKSHLQVPEFRT